MRHGYTGSDMLTVSPKVFEYLIHNEYQSILHLEKLLGCKVILESNQGYDEKTYIIKKV